MYRAILDQIAITDSTNEKLALLKANASDELLKRIYRLTYSRRLQYGIKKIPEFVVQNSDDEKTLEGTLDFLEHVLATRQITGHAAIDSLKDHLEGLNGDDAEVIRRVVLRDLECGASRTMANKVWKNLVPEQPQMLATAYSDKAIANIKFPAYAQLKADGARCFAEIRGDNIEDVKLLSRAGNEYLGLDSIKLQLIDATKEEREKHPEGVLIDGELVFTRKAEADPLAFLMGPEGATGEAAVVLRSESNGFANKSLKGTITPDEAECMTFQVWDLVPLDVVYSEGTDIKKSEPYDTRFHLLTWAIDAQYDKLIVIENTVVNNLVEAREVYKKYVEQGLEGIILKNIHGQWENKRSKNQVKFKEVITIEMKITGFYPHSKDPNKLGGIELVSECGKITCNSGSGLTDTTQVKVKKEWVPIPLHERDELDREALWANRAALPGQIIELECNGWVTSKTRKDGTVGLFLPIIKKFRFDKSKANTFEDAFGIPFSDTGVKNEG